MLPGHEREGERFAFRNFKQRTISPELVADLGKVYVCLRINYTRALYEDTGSTLDDLREAVTTLEELERIARRVLGNSHPTTTMTEGFLRDARATLRAREAREALSGLMSARGTQ